MTDAMRLVDDKPTPYKWLKGSEPTIVGLAQELLTYWLGHEGACQLLDALGVSVFSYVVDTNIIIQDLSRYLQTQQLTGLMIAAKFGGLRLFASTDVRDEVPERLVRLTSRRGFPIEQAQARWWRDYAPLITFLDPADLRGLSPRAERVAAVDPDDVATGKIIDLIRPHGTLSEDHDLDAYDPVGSLWTQVAVALRDIARRDANYVVIHIGGGFTLWIGASAIGGLASLLRRLNRRFLLGAGLTLLLVATIVGMQPSSRGWLREKAHQFLDVGIQRVHDFLAMVAEGLMQLHEQNEQARRASSFILDHQVPHNAPRLVADYLPEILSRSHVPLRPAEITQQMIRRGYEPRGSHPERYVAHVLRAHPRLFEQQRPGRWGLRSHKAQEIDNVGCGE